jgi:hypothetical protein
MTCSFNQIEFFPKFPKIDDFGKNSVVFQQNFLRFETSGKSRKIVDCSAVSVKNTYTQRKVPKFYRFR